MSDYSNMSIEDLEDLKKNLLNQISNLNNTIRFKNTQASDRILRLNPYYKDKSSYLKVIINDEGGYIITKVTPSGDYLGISQFLSNTVDFLKYYEMCSKSEWESAIDKFNIWFKVYINFPHNIFQPVHKYSQQPFQLFAVTSLVPADNVLHQ